MTITGDLSQNSIAGNTCFGKENKETTVLFLPMDEASGSSAYDKSGNQNTGAITGATWDVGEYGSGLHFDGSNDGLAITNTVSLQSAAFTVSVWVNASDVSAGEHIIIGTTNGKCIELNGARLRVTTNNGAYWLDTGYDFVVGVPAVVTITYDGAILNVYVNGVYVAHVDTNVNGALNANYFVGSNITIDAKLFHGILDNIIILNIPCMGALFNSKLLQYP
jgi:hypothetical protein